MLQRDDIHAISLCVPSGMRAEMGEACAKAGKHILSEKPLEVTTERVDRLINAARDNHVKLGCIFQYRFADGPLHVMKALEQGRFGRLVLGDAYIKWYRSPEYYKSGKWRGTRALDGGGALMNQAIHQVDLLLWMMGPVTHISGFTALLAHQRIEVEDTAVACLRFASGALGVIQATTSVHPGLPKTIAIHGDRGTVVIEQDDLIHWQFAEERPEDAQIRERFAVKTGASGGSADPKAISHVGHARQLADFINALRTGGRPLVDGREGRKAVEVIQAIYRSAATGKTIEIGG
jgi:predicted dehydrogenase